MSGSADDAADPPRGAMTAESVSAWLRRHPDFLIENPELLSFLTPPEFKRGERIVDMQRFMLDRLREEVSVLRRRERQLLSAAEGNAAGQAKVHQAAIAIVGAPDIDALTRIVGSTLPALLDIEAAVLCVEEVAAAPFADAVVIGRGGIGELAGQKRRIHMRARSGGSADVFGDAADRVKSVAYLRIRPGGATPNLLLALGSGREDGFDPRQATDLLGFLADALEARLRQCLPATA